MSIKNEPPFNRGSTVSIMVLVVGIEPTWSQNRSILSAVRLPVPPHKQIQINYTIYFVFWNKKINNLQKLVIYFNFKTVIILFTKGDIQVNLDNYYLHGICICDNNDFTNTLITLEQILKSGHLLSLSLQEKYDQNKIGYNGLNYISVCDPTKKEVVYNNKKICINYNAFSYHIKRSVSFALDKTNIEVVKPILLEPYFMRKKSEKEMLYLINHPTRKFSDYPDELLVKSKISLTELEFILVPLTYFLSNSKGNNNIKNYDDIVNLLKSIKILLKKYDWVVPIYDLDTMINIDDNINLRRLINK